MADFSELKIYLTGGAANSDVTVSTGGIVSSTEVVSQTVTATTTLTGVTTVKGTGNREGVGTLSYFADSGLLYWTPYGGQSGTGVDVSSNGTYFVQGGNNGGAIVVTVVSSSLPTSNTSNSITVANVKNTMFDDITKDESDTGVTYYHIFALKNTGTEKKKDVRIWVAENTPGQDTISIGVGSAAAGNGSTTGIETDTAGQANAPSGITFTTPTSYANGLVVGDLSGSGGSTHTRCFAVKLTVPAGVDTTYLNNYFSIGYSAKV